jgi:RNA polymerase sigma-70 factor, ECF subfamily
VPDFHAEIFHLHSVLVVTVEGDRISAITNFIDTGVAPYFGLPRTLPG